MKEATPLNEAATLKHHIHYSSTPDLNQILSRLDKVRQHQKGRYMALCPAHQDRSPSLSIKQTEDGRILMHCFAGCHIEDVCSAIGLEVKDLFPRTDRHQYTTLPDWKRQRYQDALSRERLILELAKSDKARGRPLSKEDKERVIQAENRVRKLEGLLNG